MTPVLRHRIPACVWSLLTDIEPRGERQCWREEDVYEKDAAPVTRDGIALPGRGTSKPGELLAPAGEIQDAVNGAGGSDTRSRVCGLCLSKPLQYTCPRCNVPYCSLACYKSPTHSACSEEFYKESVFQELKSIGETDMDGRRQMQEILMRLRERDEGMEDLLRQLEEEGHSNIEQNQEALELLSRLTEIQSSGGEDNGDKEAILVKLKEIGESIIEPGQVGDAAEDLLEDKGDTEEEDLVERLSGLDLDSLAEEQLWALLPQQDKENFEGMIKGGAIAGLVPLWRPWWERHDGGNGTLIKMLVDNQEQQSENLNVEEESTIVREGWTPRGQVIPKMGRKEKDSTGQQVNHNVKDEGMGGCLPQSLGEKEQTEIEMVLKVRCDEEAAEHYKKVQPLEKQGHNKKSNPKNENVSRLESGAAVPPVNVKIPSLHSLSPNVSPLVRYSLVNMLYGYSFSLCLFNGDIEDSNLLQEFCQVVLAISESLSSNRVFNTLQEALEGGATAIMAGGYGDQGDPSALVRTVEAVAHILTGTSRNDQVGYSLAALSQLRRALSKARQALSKEGNEGETRQKYFLAGKKCEFLQAWVKENGLEVRALAKAVWVELGKREQEREILEKGKKEVENSWKKSGGRKKGPLVEEIV
ncbi:zinc finger HIT domain-containing protein 2 [Arapaima gigas]